MASSAPVQKKDLGWTEIKLSQGPKNEQFTITLQPPGSERGDSEVGLWDTMVATLPLTVQWAATE